MLLRPDWSFEVHAPQEVLQAVFGRSDEPWMRARPAGGRGSRLKWEFLDLPRMLLADRDALLFASFGPFWNIALATRAVVRLENLLAVLEPSERVISPSDDRRLRILRHVYLANARRALRPVCASLHSRARYVRLTGLEPERFAVIPHGVDAARVQSAIPSPVVERICRQQPFLLTVGQATPYRQTRETIQAYRILAERAGAALPPLVWVGSARREDLDYERECLDLLDPLVQARAAVHLPQVARDDVFALDRSACLLVHPSVHEDCPNTILEGLAAGAPIVCADIPANREFANGAVEFTPDATPATLAATIRALLADPERRSALSRAGRETAARLTWDNTAQVLADALDDAFAERRRERGRDRPRTAGNH